MITVNARHISKTYRLSTSDDRVSGRGWYATARQVAESLDPTDPSRAAAVIAVLSPRLSWKKNVDAAQDAYAGRPIKTLGASAAKARAILAGADPHDIVSGPKTRAFWFTITDPTDPRSVVVDRHAVDVAIGRVLNDAERGKILGRVGGYDAVSDAYRRAARSLSKQFGIALSPADVQATTWLYWRRERAAANHG